MKTKIITLSLLMGLATSSFAAQCPSASDFIHVKGQPWRLSQQAVDRGWLLSEQQSDYSKNSNFTTLPGDVILYTTINELGYTSCRYYLTPAINNMLLALPLQLADVKSLSRPPFYLGGMSKYTCDTTAYAPAVCQWQWKS